MCNMDNKENVGAGVPDRPNASLSEGGGTAVGGDGGSSTAQTSANETPSVCPADSQFPQGGSPDDETDEPQSWYVDLNREEFVAFRMLTARMMGPLRRRKPTIIASLLCSLVLVAYALIEWWCGAVPSPDPVLLVGGVLVLIPALAVWLYLPYHIAHTARKQFDHSVESGMDYYGELTIHPDCIEKAGYAITSRIRLDERALFIETPEMMVITNLGSPAIVLPARCMTEELARRLRRATEDTVPFRNRRFYGRVLARGEIPDPPPPREKPVELWVNTFTYTTDEYAVVIKGMIRQNFWRMAPLLAAVSMMGAVAFGYNGESLLPCIGFFVAFIAILMVLNLVLPLRRVATQCAELSPHDLTVQVRMDTMALRLKLPKGAENFVLWCDVDHVYDRDDFVEIVHNKKSSLYIPKRCIDDLDALDAVIKHCRGEQ